jgi:hypothetical protein
MDRKRPIKAVDFRKLTVLVSTGRIAAKGGVDGKAGDGRLSCDIWQLASFPVVPGNIPGEHRYSNPFKHLDSKR